ncbi:Glutamine--fructose-6-phosphate aminotransferase [Desulfonema limicola]|uniref:Glutamine--fructose-6-phosphate aminotransferase [isomerizing] n=1 Tax=Desulfonema limicola TaxID=45656 RepID=A0A975B630_9BACT|nr:SIS domain-containing protein [Desulfonema limicola]QTA79474.1 Glutamine--fructose-6-phosphate aminotransferase [Desulfonema limicola]
MCGLAGIVSIKHKKDDGQASGEIDLYFLKETARTIQAHGFEYFHNNQMNIKDNYLGGSSLISEMTRTVTALKQDKLFYSIFSNNDTQDSLSKISGQLEEFIKKQTELLSRNMGHLSAEDVDIMSARIESVKDIIWCLRSEIEENVKKINNLLYRSHAPESITTIFKRINAVLNSIDRLEVRGRDSAGISMMFILDRIEFDAFKDTLDKANFLEQFNERNDSDILMNMGITINEPINQDSGDHVAIAFTYKIAAEIGSLGDNVLFLRQQIKNDTILQAMVNFPYKYYTLSSHTRWASVGAISEQNCHPVDNKTLIKEPALTRFSGQGIFHVCLNGDIDNYLELKKDFEDNGCCIHQDITTDTKIIPLQIEKYIAGGADVEEAFRLAVNNFEGSHAISMHTDLAPGRLFLAQKGSGQAIFVGLADDHYMSVSEVYGFIEETSCYLKMDGEKTIQGRDGMTRGQIFILNQDSPGGLDGIKAMYYDGTPAKLQESDIKYTEIRSRDIDRQGFPHYFLKEISEAPVSVEKTLMNRWRIIDNETEQYKVSLDKTVIPDSLENALINDKIRQILFVGQGTAGVAAQACANILEYYMNDPSLVVNSLKASELSGFKLRENVRGMEDTLVIAISQSGTTTDTNKTVDMVKERGAHTLAIVNRRDSDITFKVDGVMYTSSGRDIEMSVASTKAFYSQIVAGALLGLYMANLKGQRNNEFVGSEIKQLLSLPAHMRKILSIKERIENSARNFAVSRTYWAAVGSGPNKTSADEIRIKLSELCYKTISSDFVEDKKHIDLSSEPLIIICAAGTRETVIGDIIKDTAIFKAHKAVPIVIADEGEDRFTPYAADVFHVPRVSEHLAPVVNTLVGHIWGYYAALSINEGSRFLYDFREEVRTAIDEYVQKGLDIYELILEKSFREKMAVFYNTFRKRRIENTLPPDMGLNTPSDLTLLLKYLSGRLPVTDFDIDFSVKGTAKNMLDTLFTCLGEAINSMARPVDAIKHQAKTVTVGTSRISEKIEGLLFDALSAHNFKPVQLTPNNIIVIKNLQEVISAIQGMTIYTINNLNLLGEPTDDTTIEVISREGTSMSIPSRVDKDKKLKGTKRTIVQRGNIYIGKGRKDNRSILCIPLISASLSTSNMIENLVLFHISFKDNIALSTKIKALGGKYEHIKNIVLENSVSWDDKYIEWVEISELFGRSAEKIGEFIVSRLK